jgi:hypothetical protein
MKTLTEAAQVAKLVRNELKVKHPGIKFSVRSETYAGGDAVRVSYTIENATDPKESTIQAMLSKYTAGHFDGMTDSYEYKKGQTGPSVMYVSVSADTRPLQAKVLPEFLKYWGLAAYDDTEIMKKLGMWKEQAVYRYINQHVLTA